MIYQICMFNNENLIAAINAKENYKDIDKLYIIESNRNFHGDTKTLNYNIKKKPDNVEYRVLNAENKFVKNNVWGKIYLAIRLYYSALENTDRVCGQAYNIGGTMEQSLSLLELFDMLNDVLGIKMEYKQLPPCQSDQKVFVADITKINERIGWKPLVTAREGVTAMVDWVRDIRK